jgi:hypothetical protein
MSMAEIRLTLILLPAPECISKYVAVITSFSYGDEFSM